MGRSCNKTVKSWIISFTFPILWVRIHYKIELKIQEKNLDYKIVLTLSTSPFLSDQMAVLSSFLQVFTVLGMYNFILHHTYLSPK